MIGRLSRLGVAAATGAFLALAWHPADLGWIAWFGLAPLLVLSVRDGGRGFSLDCYLFGVAHMSVGCAWLYELTPVGGTLMALAHSALFFLPIAWVLGPILRHGKIPLLAAAPIVWITFEWIRTWLATGFPWLLLGHTQWSSPGLVRVSAFVGAYGLSFAIVAVNASLAQIALRWLSKGGERRSPARGWWLVPALSIVGVLLASFTRAPELTGAPLRIAVIQGNVAQRLKRDALEQGRPDGSETFARHATMSVRAVEMARERWGTPPDVVIWPETMLPGRYRPGTAGWDRNMRWVAAQIRTPLLTGALATRTSEGEDTYNSTLVFDREGRPRGRYEKVHLVPGGEYVPLRGILPESVATWIGGMIEEYAGFHPSLSEGESLEPVAIPDDGRKLGPLVCYEVIYPALARGHARAGADVLVNLTNYGWFRESAQLEQANAIAVFRAVETGLPVVVAANTGISAVIHPDGRIAEVLADTAGRRKSVEGILLAEVPCAAAGENRGTAYVAMGDLFVLSLAALSALLMSAAIRVRMIRRKAA